MCKFLKWLIIPFLVLISGQAMAQDGARMFAAKWITDTVKRVSDQDASTIVTEAFKQGNKHKIDPLILLAVMKKESTFNRRARSSHNAQGLMQVMPRWHKDKIRGRDLYSVPVNIEVGSKILSDCLDKGKGNLNKALRCYTGGHNPKYYADVRKYHSSMKRWVIENQFKYQLPVYYVQYNEDKLKL